MAVLKFTSPSSSSSDEQCPVIEAVRKEQIGRNMLLLSIPLSTGLAAYHATDPHNPALISVLIAIVCVGAAAIINGLAFRNVSPKLSGVLELVGIALVLLCFFLYLTSLVPPYLAWLPVLCFFVSVVPTAVAAARFLQKLDALPT